MSTLSFPCSVTSVHDALARPWWKKQRCILNNNFLNRKIFTQRLFAWFTFGSSLPRLSAGYKCLMHRNRHSDSMLQRERGNKVDKYQTFSGAALCPLCWNTYCKIYTSPETEREREKRAGTKKRCTWLNHLGLPENTSAVVFISWQGLKSLLRHNKHKAVL